MDDFYLVWDTGEATDYFLNPLAHSLPSEFSKLTQSDVTHLISWKALSFKRLVEAYVGELAETAVAHEKSSILGVGSLLLKIFFNLKLEKTTYDDPAVELVLKHIGHEFGDAYLDEAVVSQLAEDYEDIHQAIRKLMEDKVIQSQSEAGRYYFYRHPFARVQREPAFKMKVFLPEIGEAGPESEVPLRTEKDGFHDVVRTNSMTIRSDSDSEKVLLELKTHHNQTSREWLEIHKLPWQSLKGLVGKVFGKHHGVFSVPFDSGAANIRNEARLEGELLGDELFSMVFEGCHGQNWKNVVIEQENDSKHHLRLVVEYPPMEGGPSALGALPWELLRDGVGHLQLRPGFSVVRRLSLPKRFHFPSLPRPLKVALVKGWLGEGDERLNDDYHLLSPLTEDVDDVVIRKLDPCSTTELSAQLTGEKFHVVHVYGHGFEEGGLFLGNEEKAVAGPSVWKRIFSVNQPQLVYFNVCQRHRPGRQLGALGDADLATAVLKAGIANAITMQSTFRQEQVTTLVKKFYQDVFRGFPFDVALSRARFLAAGEKAFLSAWSLPTLFLQHDEFDRIQFNDPHRPIHPHAPLRRGP